MRSDFIRSINVCNPHQRETAANFCNAMAAILESDMPIIDPELYRHPEDHFVSQLIHTLDYRVKEIYPSEDRATQWLIAEVTIRDTLSEWQMDQGTNVIYFPAAEPNCRGYQAITLCTQFFHTQQWCTNIDIYDAISGLVGERANRAICVPMADLAVELK